MGHLVTLFSSASSSFIWEKTDKRKVKTLNNLERKSGCRQCDPKLEMIDSLPLNLKKLLLLDSFSLRGNNHLSNLTGSHPAES